MVVFEVPAIRTTRTRYDDQVKELAYEVYSKRCNGDMPETIKLLAELIDPPLSEKTIYYWRDELGWRQRLQAEKEAIAPHSWALYFGGLTVAGPEVVSRLRQIVNDDDANPRDQIAAGRVLLQQIAVHLEQLEQRNQPPEPTSISDSLTSEQLLAMEQELAAGGTGTG